MIRDVGEDPLSPALRDIERGRGGGGARTALDTRWLRLLCLVCWCRGEALKVKKRPLRLSSRNECYPSSIFKPSLGRREIYLSLLSGIRKRNIIFIKAHVQEIRIQNNRIKINNGKLFSFLLEIYSEIQNSQITVYFLRAGICYVMKRKAGKCHHVKNHPRWFNQSAAAASLGFEWHRLLFL